MKDIYIHHSGGMGTNKYASSAHLTPESIDKYHKNKWNFKSNLGHYGGYNFIYDPKTREFTQHREIGEETAAQRGFNDQCSLCTIGNHNKAYVGSPKKAVDELTRQTRDDISKFLSDLINGNRRNLAVTMETTLKFSITKIFPHRKVGSTECYGSFLDDSVFKADLISLYTKKIGLLKRLLELYVIILGLFQRRNAALSSSNDRERECDGLIEL